MSKDINRTEWKETNPEENMKMFRTINRKYLVPRIEEVIV